MAVYHFGDPGYDDLMVAYLDNGRGITFELNGKWYFTILDDSVGVSFSDIEKKPEKDALGQEMARFRAPYPPVMPNTREEL